MGLGVLDLLLPGLDVPNTPGGDDLHIRGEGLDGQLEAHLVVALAGAAVADGVGALFLGDVHNALGDDGPGERGAQQVLVLVHGPGLDGGVDVVLDELLFQVQHVQLGGPGLLGLFLQAVQLGALAHVAGDGDDLAVVVVLLQPGDDDGGVQAAGVGQHYFFDLVCHNWVPSLSMWLKGLLSSPFPFAKAMIHPPAKKCKGFCINIHALCKKENQVPPSPLVLCVFLALR